MYRDKYLKYKAKYVGLKNFNMFGGGGCRFLLHNSSYVDPKSNK